MWYNRQDIAASWNIREQNRSVRLDRAGYKYSEKGRSYPMDKPLPLLCIRGNFVDECSVYRLCAADSRYLGLREVV